MTRVLATDLTEVLEVFVCIACEKEYDSRKGAATCHPNGDVEADAEEVEAFCLCGARLIVGDYRPSLMLGSQIYCQRCRDKVLDGMPSNEAIRQSFVERGIEVR